MYLSEFWRCLQDGDLCAGASNGNGSSQTADAGAREANMERLFG